jgi:hypothetical protein
MIDVSKYTPESTVPISSLMVLVDAVYFNRLNSASNKINHRLALLFYHKRKKCNANGSIWDKWARILYLLPSYRDNEITEFSKFFFALTGQKLEGKYDNLTLERIGKDIVSEVKNNNHTFKITWVKQSNFYTINWICKSDYFIERPTMIEWPEGVLKSYAEIAAAQPPEIKDPDQGKRP